MTLICKILLLQTAWDTVRCRFTHTRHTFQWRLWWPVDEIIQTLIWNIYRYLQDIKLIFHMTYKQREMNSLSVILTYFIIHVSEIFRFQWFLNFCFFNVDSKWVFIFKTIYHIHHHLGLYKKQISPFAQGKVVIHVCMMNNNPWHIK
jgi:hypothetical protein